MQPRRKSWLNSEAKSFPQISARRVCSQQIEMLLMFIIWPDSLFIPDEATFQFCVCVYVSVFGGGEWVVPSVLTAFFPKAKRHPRTPSLHCPWLFFQVAQASLHPANDQNSQELTKSWRKVMGSKKKNYHRVSMPYFFSPVWVGNKGVMAWEGGRLIVFSGHVHFIFIVIVLIVMKLLSIHADVTSSSSIDVLL